MRDLNRTKNEKEKKEGKGTAGLVGAMNSRLYHGRGVDEVSRRREQKPPASRKRLVFSGSCRVDMNWFNCHLFGKLHEIKCVLIVREIHPFHSLACRCLRLMISFYGELSNANNTNTNIN